MYKKQQKTYPSHSIIITGFCAGQIYLLAAPPSSLVTKLFRVHINLLNGAILALLFPVTNTRLVHSIHFKHLK